VHDPDRRVVMVQGAEHDARRGSRRGKERDEGKPEPGGDETLLGRPFPQPEVDPRREARPQARRDQGLRTAGKSFDPGFADEFGQPQRLAASQPVPGRQRHHHRVIQQVMQVQVPGIQGLVRIGADHGNVDLPVLEAADEDGAGVLDHRNGDLRMSRTEDSHRTRHQRRVRAIERADT
jgi:hypothetical protein